MAAQQHTVPSHGHHAVAQVIELNVSTVSSDPKKTVDISPGAKADMEVIFSYSVKWKKTDIDFDDRMDRYSRYSFLPQHLEVRVVLSLRCGKSAWTCV